METVVRNTCFSGLIVVKAEAGEEFGRKEGSVKDEISHVNKDFVCVCVWVWVCVFVFTWSLTEEV